MLYKETPARQMTLIYNGVFVADVNGLSLVGCTNPNPVNGYIWGNFTNGTGTDRYAIRIYTEVLINGVFETTLNTCAFDTLASGVNQDAFLVGPVIWTCGDQLTLQNTWIAWDTNGSTCGTCYLIAATLSTCQVFYELGRSSNRYFDA